MRKVRVRASVFVITFLMFILLMDYPYLSRIYNDHIAGEVIASYGAGEGSSDCQERLRWAEAYNRFLSGEGEYPKTGSWFTDGQEGEGSESSKWERAAHVLCLDGSEEAGWIKIESLDLMLPLYIGTGDKALQKGAGILEESSLPVGGVSTHACISAHRGLPDKTLFTNLDLLKEGDKIRIHTLNRTIVYEVTGSETVLPHETKHLSIRKGEDLLSLITCTPYGINTHRLYVHAKRCTDPEEEDSVTSSVKRGIFDPLFWKLWWWVPASFLLILFMLILVIKRVF